MGCLQSGMRFLPLYLALACVAIFAALDAVVRLRLRKVGEQSRPFSGRVVQLRKVSQATKTASLVGMASLFDLDGLVGGHRTNAFESPIQHCPPARGILSEMGISRQLTNSFRLADDSGAGGDKRVYQGPEVVPGIVLLPYGFISWNARVPSDQ